MVGKRRGAFHTELVNLVGFFFFQFYATSFNFETFQALHGEESPVRREIQLPLRSL